LSSRQKRVEWKNMEKKVELGHRGGVGVRLNGLFAGGGANAMSGIKMR